MIGHIAFEENLEKMKWNEPGNGRQKLDKVLGSSCWWRCNLKKKVFVYRQLFIVASIFASSLKCVTTWCPISMQLWLWHGLAFTAGMHACVPVGMHDLPTVPVICSRPSLSVTTWWRRLWSGCQTKWRGRCLWDCALSNMVSGRRKGSGCMGLNVNLAV